MYLRIALVTAKGVGKISIMELKLKNIPYSKVVTCMLKTQEVTFVNVEYKYVNTLFLLRTVEDIFVVLYEEISVLNNNDIKNLISKNLKSRIISNLKYIQSKRKRKKTTNFWVFVKQDRDRLVHRKNIATTITNYISENFKLWKEREPSDVELWAFYIKQKVSLGLRLTDISFRQRSYKKEERSGSLRPTLASTLVLVSDPKDNDYFIDPMCGVGTIPIERTFWGSSTFIGGLDIDKKAIDLAIKNSSSLKKKIEFCVGDSTKYQSLEKHNKKINKIVTNLPFGKKFGMVKDLEKLYSDAIQCWAKIIAPNGEIYLLTSQNNIIQKVLHNNKIQYKIEHTIDVQGIRSYIYRLYNINNCKVFL